MGTSYYIGCLKHQSCLCLGKWLFPWGHDQNREDEIRKDFYKIEEKDYKENDEYYQIEIIKEFLKVHENCIIIGTTDQDRGSEDFKFHDCDEYSVYDKNDFKILSTNIKIRK